jgi:hypothetical protein
VFSSQSDLHCMHSLATVAKTPILTMTWRTTGLELLATIEFVTGSILQVTFPMCCLAPEQICGVGNVGSRSVRRRKLFGIAPPRPRTYCRWSGAVCSEPVLFSFWNSFISRSASAVLPCLR